MNGWRIDNQVLRQVRTCAGCLEADAAGGDVFCENCRQMYDALPADTENIAKALGWPTITPKPRIYYHSGGTIHY